MYIIVYLHGYYIKVISGTCTVTGVELLVSVEAEVFVPLGVSVLLRGSVARRDTRVLRSENA